MKNIATTLTLMFSFLSAGILIPSCSPAQKEGIVRVSNEEFTARLNQQDYILLDVRTPEEFEAAHIEGSVLINVLDKTAFLSKIRELDKKKKILVYCRTGNRSMTAANLLSENGFKEIYELRNGIMGWNGPVVSSKNQ